MFREMRRFKQALSKEDCIKILEGQNTGVLAVNGDDGYPYAVPMSYIYADGKIYFHSAKSGHKNDAIMRNPKVSFCVTETDVILPKDFTLFNYQEVLKMEGIGLAALVSVARTLSGTVLSVENGVAAIEQRLLGANLFPSSVETVFSSRIIRYRYSSELLGKFFSLNHLSPSAEMVLGHT